VGQFIKGDVLVVPFPFTDFSTFKPRPALVLAILKGDDMIMCMITTPQQRDGQAIELTAMDFASGAIDHESFIRPNRLFTFAAAKVIRKKGKLETTKVKQIVDAVVRILQA
jgi:mRNA interferase MazF